MNSHHEELRSPLEQVSGQKPSPAEGWDALRNAISCRVLGRSQAERETAIEADRQQRNSEGMYPRPYTEKTDPLKGQLPLEMAKEALLQEMLVEAFPGKDLLLLHDQAFRGKIEPDLNRLVETGREIDRTESVLVFVRHKEIKPSLFGRGLTNEFGTRLGTARADVKRLSQKIKVQGQEHLDAISQRSDTDAEKKDHFQGLIKNALRKKQELTKDRLTQERNALLEKQEITVDRLRQEWNALLEKQELTENRLVQERNALLKKQEPTEDILAQESNALLKKQKPTEDISKQERNDLLKKQEPTVDRLRQEWNALLKKQELTENRLVQERNALYKQLRDVFGV